MDDRLFKKCLIALLIATICAGSYWLFMASSNSVMVQNFFDESEIISSE